MIIEQQLSCPVCTSNTQKDCDNWPTYPTYKFVYSKTFAAPASGSAPVKIIISQAPQTEAVVPLLITALNMYSRAT